MAKLKLLSFVINFKYLIYIILFIFIGNIYSHNKSINYSSKFKELVPFQKDSDRLAI